MSINTLLENPASQSKPWCNLYVDTLTAYKGAKINGNLDVGGDITSDGDVIWPINIDLSKIEPPTGFTQPYVMPVATWNEELDRYQLTWAPPIPSMLVGGQSNSVLIRNEAGYGAWSTNPTVSGITVLDNAKLDGNLILNSNSGTTGQVLTKTSNTTQDWVDPPEVGTGAANSVLTTNSAGTDIEWVNEINVNSVTTNEIEITGTIFTPLVNDDRKFTNVLYYERNINLEYWDGVSTSGVLPDLDVFFDVTVQRINRQIFFNIPPFSFTLTNAGLGVIDMGGNPTEYSPRDNSYQLVRVKYDIVTQIGMIKSVIIGPGRYLVVYPNAIDESELFPESTPCEVLDNVTLSYPGLY